MPWTAKSARKHTKAAKTPTEKRQWKDVANSVLAKTGDEGRAIASANAVVKRRKKP
jgi:hypothetical protein